MPTNLALAKRVRAIAAERGLSLAQLSLAWVASQGEDVVPIPGTTSIKHLEDNAKAMGVALSREECDLIASAVPVDEVAGKRYADGLAATYKDNL
jgi:aryl-alcohol dehydrogenase-like predicted oxidoreductase